MGLKQVRWMRVLAGGFAAEIVLLPFALLQLLPGGATLLLYLVLPLCLLVTAIAGAWAGKKAGTAHVLHGALVGVVALLIYTALTWSQELPAIYVVANFSKIVGGAVGGWYAGKALEATAERGT